MSKFVLLLAICCMCLLQVEANRKTCDEVSAICVKAQRLTGPEDDVTNLFNFQCRRQNRNWKNITRCQLERAACLLTLVKCDRLSCVNVINALRG
ncbi:uncharacterized protein [Drosophila virilis]|uniref:Uncharacterized protein n=1 Tax=Drosophila virilis TaxID=7244 RepID=B4LII2_DROVI|nr:uncharacterized protein LOC6622131 [Drosophila virilis]EDW70769.1 uncharacterized protein Dvir_GJ13962 [Drosophila virilis]